MIDVCVLEGLTPVSIQGADARKFIQVQQSNDVRKLTPKRALLGSCTSGQGRVLAVVTLIEREEGIVALFPTATLERTLLRLRAAIFSTKVSFERMPWALAAISAAQAATLSDSMPQTPGDCVNCGELTLLRWWSAEERYLLLAPNFALAVDRTTPSHLQDLRWRSADLAAGLPQVYADTQSSFVPQMLNLDLLNAISFDKGCYIGQEVVARARRGGVSRRMFRFTAACAAPAPGARVLSGESQAGEVVDAVNTELGCDLLAVVDLDQASNALHLEGCADSTLTRAGLPYAVPMERR